MKTSFISAYNLETLAQTNGTHEITVNTSKEFYALHDYLVFTLGWDCYEYAHVSQDGSVTINIRVNNNQPEPTNPDNTPTTMNANEINNPEFSELSHAETIARRIEAMKPRGAWNNGVKQYALMLLDWYETEANESPLTLDTMLNGAKDWKQYARGGAGVAQCYNARIAETLCSPSELKRNNHGAKMPNRFEDWQDIEARALFHAWQLITEAETLVNCNA